MSDDATLPSSAGPKTVNRARRPLIVTAVVLLLLVIVAVALDGVARAVAQTMIQSSVRTSLGLPASAPVEVNVRGTSVLLQLASGSLQEVDVKMSKLSVGGFSGAADLTVRGVPLDQSRPLSSATVALTLGRTEVQKLLTGFAALPVKSVTLSNGAVHLGGEFSLFGLAIPVTVTATAAAVDGQVALTPTSFMVNAATFTPAALTKSFGALGESLTSTQRLCIASSLPAAFHLDTVTISGAAAHLVTSAKSVVLSSHLFSTKGVCP